MNNFILPTRVIVLRFSAFMEPYCLPGFIRNPASPGIALMSGPAACSYRKTGIFADRLTDQQGGGNRRRCVIILHMETRMLDGKKVAAEIKADVQKEVEQLRDSGIVPGLSVVLAGEDPASQIYVRNKTRTCAELGMRSEQLDFPADVTTGDLLEVIERLNADDEVDGILVQLPLPAPVDEQAILSAVDPDKDVDGFHPVNAGRLFSGHFTLAPCTPMGILEMLKREGVTLEGAEAVVVGRSNIVGKPMAMLLLQQHCTVTICHSRTRDLARVCQRADILIAAVGRPALITRDFLKPGVVVVDVGTNRVDSREEVIRLFGEDSTRLEGLEKRGYTLVGDVHPREVQGIASAVTPVPGGVGPLTIAHLMKNTLIACKARRAEAIYTGS